MDETLAQEVERLRGEVALLRGAIDAAPMDIRILDEEARGFLMNKGGAVQRNRSDEMLIDKTALEIALDPEAARELHDESMAILRGEVEETDCESEYSFGDRRGWAHRRKRPIKDEDGRIIGVAVFRTDITADRHGQRERSLLVTAIDQAAEAIVITGAVGNIRYVNPAFERITGYQTSEVIGKNPRILQSGEHPDSFYREMWNTLLNQENWSGQLINRRKDGTLYREEATISPIIDEAGQTQNYVAVKRDVTHEAELEGRLRQSQKMEAIGALAGGIAHDFNNILQGIVGYIDLAKSEVSNGSAVSDYLDEVSSAANRAAQLVSQILTFSRQSDQERRPILLQSSIEEAARLMRSTLPPSINIRLDIDAKCGPVLADPVRIHQIVINLATNARQAMAAQRGEITISLREEDVDEATALRDPALSPGRHICLSVSDTGQGIPPNVIDRIFEPYFTTRENGKGTGLGLSTVHGIVKAHEGAIIVDSELGKGATFRIFLPVSSGKNASLATAASHDIPFTGNECVLVVDDEEHIARTMKLGLERFGYTVTARTSSVEAYEAFRSLPDVFDVVVTDHMMPNMTGLELAYRLFRLRPGIPMVLCTGFSDTLDETMSQEAGIREFVMKPIVARDLARAVRRALGDPPTVEG